MLMALDERISCGVAVSGLSRLSDWRSANPQDRRPLAPWAAALSKSFDTEAVLALCAPRRLQILSGDHDPLSPESGFRVVRGTVGKAYGLYSEGSQFTQKVFAGSGGELTRQKWDSLGETFDKAFHPQGPAVQPQPPEPK
jgi:hypothetical protein